MASYSQLTTVISGSNPQRITGTNKFTSAVFYGFKGFDVSGVFTRNASGIYLGFNSGEMTTFIASGANYVFPLTPKAESLNNIWFSSQSGDGIFIQYYP